jgi:hypothetical protein
MVLGATSCVDMLQELPASSSPYPLHVRCFEQEKGAAKPLNYPGNLLDYKEISEEKPQPGPLRCGEE